MPWLIRRVAVAVSVLVTCLVTPAASSQLPDRLSYRLTVGGHPLRLDLRRNDALLAPGYRELHVKEGRLLPAAPTVGSTDCLYTGRLVRLDGSPAHPSDSVGLSLCDGATGMVSLDGRPWAIQPAGSPKRVRVGRVEKGGKASFQETAFEPVAQPSGIIVQSLTPPAKFLEVFLVNDTAEFVSFGTNTESHSLALANIADALLRNGDLPVSIALIVKGQVTFLGGDPYDYTITDGEVDSFSLLDSFGQYATANLPDGDVQFLMTGLDPDGARIGLAWTGGTCGSRNEGFAATLNFQDAFSGTIMAHELGHLLGMSHDGAGNSCPLSGFIMAPASNTSQPASRWSTCSATYLTTFLNGGTAGCLDNDPTNACASDPCDANATCTSTGPGTFTCACNPGYAGDGFTCTPIDACQTSPCDPNATCTSTGPGTYSCACNPGFTGDGHTCTPINLPPTISCSPPVLRTTPKPDKSFQVPLTALVGDGEADLLTVTWTIDGNPAGTQVLPAGTTESVLHATYAVGTHVVEASVDDGHGNVTICTTSVTVSLKPR